MTIKVPYVEVRYEGDEPWYPGWRDAHGVVHIVGLHTTTRIWTVCAVVIVRGDVWKQLELYEASYEAPNCLQCIAEHEPY